MPSNNTKANEGTPRSNDSDATDPISPMIPPPQINVPRESIRVDDHDPAQPRWSDNRCVHTERTIPTSREVVHPLQVLFERLQARGDVDSGEFDVQREALVPLPLPDVRVEGEESLSEVRPGGGDAVPRHGESLRVHAPVIHGPPDLVRRERGDGREEAQEIPQTCMQRPSSARVALVRAPLHHLHVVRGKEVPEEVPSPIRREEQVQVLVRAAARLDESVQLREDPFVGGLELPGLRLLERRDEARDVPELRDELRGAADLRLADPEVVSRVRLTRDEEPDRVGAVLLDQRPRVDHVPLGAVHRATARVEAESVDEDAVERLRPMHEP